MQKIPKLILSSVVVSFLWGCASPDGKKNPPLPNDVHTPPQKSQSTPLKLLSVHSLEEENWKLEEKLAKLNKQIEDAQQFVTHETRRLSPLEREIMALSVKRDALQDKINARKEKLTKLKQLNLY